MKTHDDTAYDQMLLYFTDFLSSGLKGNKYLEKGLLTGVMRISHEGMLSGLNNLVTFDVFSDKTYASDYGFTEDEAKEICSITGLDFEEMRDWYNGIRVCGISIYNTFSIMSAAFHRGISNYWGNSGTLDIIKAIATPYQKNELMLLLDRASTRKTMINTKIGPKMLSNECNDSILHSLLVQSGYLSLVSWDPKKLIGEVSVPNLELGFVWREFIFGDILKNAQVNSFLRNMSDLDVLAANVESFLDSMFLKLSTFDLPSSEYKRPDGTSFKKIPELYYHHLVLSALIFLEATLNYKNILSNRESGDGRYDVWLDMHTVMVIIEFKSGVAGEKAETLALRASKQVKDNRYGAELGKPVIAIGCGFAMNKRVKVNCLRIEY
jgi:hypothetical protein